MRAPRAVKRGDVDGVRSALKAGASANYTAEGTISQWTPLLHAVQGDHSDIVEVLLDEADPPANPNILCGRAQTSALHIAAEFDREEIMRILLSHGGNAEIQNRSRRTAIDLARRHGHGGRCAWLLSQNSDDDNEEDVLEMEWTVVKHERPTRKARHRGDSILDDLKRELWSSGHEASRAKDLHELQIAVDKIGAVKDALLEVRASAEDVRHGSLRDFQRAKERVLEEVKFELRRAHAREDSLVARGGGSAYSSASLQRREERADLHRAKESGGDARRDMVTRQVRGKKADEIDEGKSSPGNYEDEKQKDEEEEEKEESIAIPQMTACVHERCGFWGEAPMHLCKTHLNALREGVGAATASGRALQSAYRRRYPTTEMGFHANDAEGVQVWSNKIHPLTQFSKCPERGTSACTYIAAVCCLRAILWGEFSTPEGSGIWSESISLGVSAFMQAREEIGGRKASGRGNIELFNYNTWFWLL